VCPAVSILAASVAVVAEQDSRQVTPCPFPLLLSFLR